MEVNGGTGMRGRAVLRTSEEEKETTNPLGSVGEAMLDSW